MQYSHYYKTFYGVVTVRTVTAEYLVAMKMVSARQYKNDLSDIVGIIGEHQLRNTPLTFDMIDRAVQELYGSWERISEDTKALVKTALENPNASELYRQYRASEAEAEAILLDFQQEHPNQIRETDITSVLELARAKKKKHYTKKQRRRDDRIILFIYGLIIVAFLSVVFSAWWVVFRTTRYYSMPYPSETAPYQCFILDCFIQQTT